MNINQLLNPASAPSATRAQASVRRLDHHRHYECDSTQTGNGSSCIHHLTTNHASQDRRSSGSEAQGANGYVRNNGLTSTVNEPTTQSYGVSPTYMTHGRLPILTSPPYPSDPVHFQQASPVAAYRYDISSHLPIQNISLHSKVPSYAGLTMGSTRKSEFWPCNFTSHLDEPGYANRPL